MAWTHFESRETSWTHLVKEVIEGRMEGKIGRRKPRIMLLDDIETNETYEMIKRIESKRNWMPRICFRAERQS